MSEPDNSEGPRRLDIVPRFPGQGYEPEHVASRRKWVEEKTGADLSLVGANGIPTTSMRGNIENPIGSVQMPVGVAGPLLIEGEHAKGTFFVPLATTEGALVRSYERGMAALTRAGGATVRIHRDENRVCPVFSFDTVGEAAAFERGLPAVFENLRAEAESTTRHGKLLRVESHPVGRDVMVLFAFSTGDAHGMNMIVKAADKACRWLVESGRAKRYRIFSGLESEKRSSGFLLPGGKGKKVTAGAILSREIIRSHLRVTPEDMRELWRQTVVGHLASNSVGYNGHYANGLTALFIATGQDVANVVNSAAGITTFEVTASGDLAASVTLSSLTVATVGGGTGLGTSRECLGVLGCVGTGTAKKLAEIAAATVLAGEISMGGAIASGEFVDAHEEYGRNRPVSQERR